MVNAIAPKIILVASNVCKVTGSLRIKYPKYMANARLIYAIEAVVNNHVKIVNPPNTPIELQRNNIIGIKNRWWQSSSGSNNIFGSSKN